MTDILYYKYSVYMQYKIGDHMRPQQKNALWLNTSITRESLVCE